MAIDQAWRNKAAGEVNRLSVCKSWRQILRSANPADLGSSHCNGEICVWSVAIFWRHRADAGVAKDKVRAHVRVIRKRAVCGTAIKLPTRARTWRELVCARRRRVCAIGAPMQDLLAHSQQKYRRGFGPENALNRYLGRIPDGERRIKKRQGCCPTERYLRSLKEI
jgi:hypothetical protein